MVKQYKVYVIEMLTPELEKTSGTLKLGACDVWEAARRMYANAKKIYPHARVWLVGYPCDGNPPKNIYFHGGY